MRGKVQNDRAKRTKARITPAYAGKSEIFELSHNLKKDHPRLCGEKHNLFPQNRINHRITPAYAGKRFEQGDKTYNVHGSPPPMRGKACSGWSNPLHFRITPAYAGKSRSAEYAMLL